MIRFLYETSTFAILIGSLIGDIYHQITAACGLQISPNRKIPYWQINNVLHWFKIMNVFIDINA